MNYISFVNRIITASKYFYDYKEDFVKKIIYFIYI